MNQRNDDDDNNNDDDDDNDNNNDNDGDGDGDEDQDDRMDQNHANIYDIHFNTNANTIDDRNGEHQTVLTSPQSSSVASSFCSFRLSLIAPPRAFQDYHSDWINSNNGQYQHLMSSVHSILNDMPETIQTQSPSPLFLYDSYFSPLSSVILNNNEMAMMNVNDECNNDTLTLQQQLIASTSNNHDNQLMSHVSTTMNNKDQEQVLQSWNVSSTQCNNNIEQAACSTTIDQLLLNAAQYQLYQRLLLQQQQSAMMINNKNPSDAESFDLNHQYVYYPPPPPSSPLILTTTATPSNHNNNYSAPVCYDSSPTSYHQHRPPHRLQPHQLERYGSSSSLKYGPQNESDTHHHHHHHHHHLMNNVYHQHQQTRSSYSSSSPSVSIPSNSNTNTKVLIHHHCPTVTPSQSPIATGCPPLADSNNMASSGNSMKSNNKSVTSEMNNQQHNVVGVGPNEQLVTSISRLSNCTNGSTNDNTTIIEYCTMIDDKCIKSSDQAVSNDLTNKSMLQSNENAAIAKKQAMVMAMVEEHAKQEAQLRELKGYEASAKYQPPLIDGTVAAALLTQSGTIIPDHHKRSCSQWRMTLFVFYWIIWIVFLIGVVIIVAANTQTE